MKKTILLISMEVELVGTIFFQNIKMVLALCPTKTREVEDILSGIQPQTVYQDLNNK